jgi:hypothetical protein
MWLPQAAGRDVTAVSEDIEEGGPEPIGDLHSDDLVLGPANTDKARVEQPVPRCLSRVAPPESATTYRCCGAISGSRVLNYPDGRESVHGGSECLCPA